jgi:hypothetical protein
VKRPAKNAKKSLSYVHLGILRGPPTGEIAGRTRKPALRGLHPPTSAGGAKLTLSWREYGGAYVAKLRKRPIGIYNGGERGFQAGDPKATQSALSANQRGAAGLISPGGIV